MLFVDVDVVLLITKKLDVVSKDDCFHSCYPIIWIFQPNFDIEIWQQRNSLGNIFPFSPLTLTKYDISDPLNKLIFTESALTRHSLST